MYLFWNKYLYLNLDMQENIKFTQNNRANLILFCSSSEVYEASF